MKLEKKFGQSPIFIASALSEDGGIVDSAGSTSLLSEAIHVIGCGFEEKTDWGKEVNCLLSTFSPIYLSNSRKRCQNL